MTQLDNDPPPSLASDSQTPRRPKNIVLFGETGAGKSAVVNLIAGAQIAPISADTEACTLQATKYALTLGDRDNKDDSSLNVWDTVDFEEKDSNESLNTSDTMFEKDKDVISLNVWDTVGLEDNGDPLKAIENALALVTDLHDAGGVDLLLFCIRGGRVTVAMQRHYRLFVEFLCESCVPLVVVVTHLEGEKVMENWWDRNHQTLTKYGMNSIQHACITAAPTHLRVYAAKRAKSQARLKNVLHEVLSVDRPAYKRDVKNWFVALMMMLFDFVRSGFGFFKKKTLAAKLQSRCGFPPQEAQRVADMILTSKERCK